MPGMEVRIFCFACYWKDQDASTYNDQEEILRVFCYCHCNEVFHFIDYVFANFLTQVCNSTYAVYDIVNDVDFGHSLDGFGHE